MSFLDMVDYSLALGQGVLAILLWHQAEPRLREARGSWQAGCAMALGFVLALSFPLAFSRPMNEVDPMHWGRTVRDFALVLYAACLYRHAMKVGRELTA
jgi:hypothetical protein